MVDPITLNSNQVYLAGRTQAIDPTVERITVNALLDFTSFGSYVVDFTAINQAKIIGTVRSMFMDNTANPNEVVVEVSGTQQRFTIPPLAQGVFPINAAADASKITISSDGGADIIQSASFYNYDQRPTVWYKYGNDPNAGVTNVQGTNPNGTDMDTAPDNQAVYIGGRQATGELTPVLVDASGRIITTTSGSTSVTITDGADAAQGAIANAPWAGTGNGTVISVLKALWGRLIGSSAMEYETVAASATDQVLGAAGAVGDYLDRLIIQPGTTTPGTVVIKDGTTVVYTFPGGATSVSGLLPFVIELKARSVSGAWNVTTGADITAIGIGDFS